MINKQEIIKLIKSNSSWIKFVLVIFGVSFVGGVITYYNPSLNPFSFLIKDGLSSISELGEQVLNLDFWSRVWLIFKNNIMVTTIMLFGGIILGFLPLLIIAVNSLILGFVFALMFSSPMTISLKILFLLTFIPHAIVELGTIIIVASFGLRIGLDYLVPNIKNRAQTFYKNLRNAIVIYLFAIVFLILAAIIEVLDMKVIESLVN